MEYTGSGTGSKVWFISDSRGSITGHEDNTGTSVATNTYDPYGKPGAYYYGRFQYTGQLWLEEIGLYYYKARYYNPTIRRFITTDPIGYGDGMNMYAYVGGDPVNMIDPSGLSSCYLDITYETYSGGEFTGTGVYSHPISCGGGGGFNYEPFLAEYMIIGAYNASRLSQTVNLIRIG